MSGLIKNIVGVVIALGGLTYFSMYYRDKIEPKINDLDYFLGNRIKISPFTKALLRIFLQIIIFALCMTLYFIIFYIASSVMN